MLFHPVDFTFYLFLTRRISFLYLQHSLLFFLLISVESQIFTNKKDIEKSGLTIEKNDQT